MKPANASTISPRPASENDQAGPVALHPAWRALVRYCAELQHGEIAVLKIQDGLPVLAEVVRKKVKFNS